MSQHQIARAVCSIIESLESRGLLSGSAAIQAATAAATLPPRQVEFLDRGLVAVRKNSTTNYLSWRLLATDPSTVGFNLYRSTNGAAPVAINSQLITKTTDWTDSVAPTKDSYSYFVKPVVSGIEQAASKTVSIAANSANQQYLKIPLQIPPGGTVPDAANPGQTLAFTYTANDSSVGDVDGDGEYEIIVKWEPSNATPAAFNGYTGSNIFDCYKMDGTLLWRIDIGKNIRAASQYQPFLVYDFDGDGKAEFVCRTAPGTKDAAGNNVILPGDNPDADYRNSTGRIITGPDYLTVFNGQTGTPMKIIPFEPTRNSTSEWGDNYGNRSEQFMMAVAYLDGKRPSITVGRGLFGGQTASAKVRNEVVAYNWRDGQLTKLWHFKAGKNINNNINQDYVGQGTYDMQLVDVDGDGTDEIMYGAMAINHDGTPLYTTKLGHGDAMHVTDMDPTRPGPELFMPEEDPGSYGAYGGAYRDARTGELLLAIDGHNADVGRGVAFDVDPRYLGYEMWQSADTNMYSVAVTDSATGSHITSTKRPTNYNFGLWWDADPLRELFDRSTIDKWNWTTESLNRVFTVYQAAPITTNNGTKSNPCLSGDLIGDWREEVLLRASDNTALYLFTTNIPATNRLVTLMHDVQYREAIAWQNVGYNQPPHPSFYLGADMPAPPEPNVFIAGTPADPSELAATAVSSSQIDLTWKDNSNNETAFQIEISTDGTTFTLKTTAAAGATSKSITGLDPLTTYTFRVRAINANLQSNYSNTASAKTLDITRTINAPTNLSASAISTSQINLTWNDSSDNETNFEVEISTDGTTFTLKTTVFANSTGTSITGLDAKTTYSFKVRAINATLQSDYSNIASATTKELTQGLNAPLNLKAVAVSTSQIDVTWTDTNTDETGYELELKNADGSFSLLHTTGPNYTWISVMSLDPSTTYTYRLRAIKGALFSEYSNEAFATTLGTPPPPPPVLGSISGVCFNDTNGNGVINPSIGETYAASKQVFLDLNGNDKYDAGEKLTVSDANGKWSFSNLPAGNYYVRRVFPYNFRYSTPPRDITLAAGQNVTGVSIGSTWIVRPGEISGNVFTDTNKNGRKDAGESFAAGTLVFLDTNNNGIKDKTETWRKTDSAGAFLFDALMPATYRVRPVLGAGQSATTALPTTQISAGLIVRNIAIGLNKA